MARFNTKAAKAQPTSRVTSTGRVLTTHQGGRGQERDARSELFLLAIANFVSQQTFYESGAARDDRFAALVRELAVADPSWTAALLGWLRGEGNLRTASLVGAAEYVKARLDAGATDGPANRQVIASVLRRPDEPGELLAYWTSQYGRNVPKPVKRGIADAVRRLYSGKSLLKYDTASKGYRFGDILNVVHAAPDPDKPWQGDLFQYALDRRHNPDTAVVPKSLPVLAAHRDLMALRPAKRRKVVTGAHGAQRLAEAGMTWEALAGWLQGPMDKAAWECLAEGTPVWLPDGTVAPVERVVAERLPVLAYDKEWDLREAKPGRPHPPRDSAVGNLVPTLPVRWIDNGTQPVFAVRLASGRVIEATTNHRWAVRSREGSRRPTWKTSADLTPGCAVPAPLTADFFGTLGDEWDGWFVGSMLGDGNMTGRTPTWVGHDDGTLQQIRDYAAKHGCQANVEDNGTWLRVRLTDPAWHRNALRDLLIEHQVWGLKGEGKRVANLPYSRAFICGLIAGLIDSDGSVEARQVSFANISEDLVRQLGDALLRLGVQSSISSKKNNHSEKPLWLLRVADGRSVARMSELVKLRADHKAEALDSLAAQGRASRRSATGARGYANSIVWDRIISITPAGVKKTYCVEVQPSHLWVVNGAVTGNCIIPSMGSMALVRNLRNFDEAGVSDEVAAQVAAKISDPAEVARSRQFPFRYLAAYQHAPSLRWSYPLEQALGHSLANVPTLPGRTLVLVDRSGSMFYSRLSDRSELNRADAAAIFGTALALRAADADLVEFGTTSNRVKFRKGESVLKVLERFGDLGGTNTSEAVRKHYKKHDRVLIVTDEQAMYSHYGDPTEQVPAHVPVYTWNLAGYQAGHGPSGKANRHTFGGLSDAAFRMVPLLESARDADWPWAA